ncbi:MAG: hypothetical protein KJO06_13390 [Gemmatimonadetes bacterium]|nr:hypothetical protein [Gemmatimonadota bacterium]
MRQKSLPQRIATWVIVALIAATLLRTWDRMRSPPEPVVREVVERPDLVKWGMPGCYTLRADTWEWDTPASDTTAFEVPAFLAVPTRVRLLADSTDQWRRTRVTYRAVPLTGEHDPRVRDYMRWVVRADTLWLIWSDGRAGGGVALRSVGDSLLGRARVFDRVAEIDGSSSAAAWRINCRTLERQSTERRPRR